MNRMTLALGLLALTLPLAAQDTHRVQASQTLYSIARLYNVTVDQLRSWNGLDGNAVLRTGQVLRVSAAAAPTPAVNPGLTPFRYQVRSGDTLAALAVKFGTPVAQLRALNSLAEDQGLYVGQRLYIRRPVGVTFYTVEAGDTLARIGAVFGLGAGDLAAINQTNDAALKAGRVLRVFRPSELPLNHTVAAIDTPAGLAALYGLSMDEIARLNGQTQLRLQVGQVLRLRAYAAASQGVTTSAAKDPVPTATAPASPTPTAVAFPEASATTYLVQRGDSLLKITRLFGLRLADLLAWNGLSADSVLRVGQELRVSAPTSSTAIAVSAPVAAPPALPKAQATVAFPEDQRLPAFRDEDQAKIRWDNYVVLDKNIPVFEWNDDYYYWTHPGELSQPNRGYYENNWPSPLDAYQKAKQLLARFDELIERKPALSNLLAGTTFVLDPGHGGLDPGAIVQAGPGVYLTEHEYVYDISLRIYALLKRHGASVKLTVAAPSHLIRETPGETTTLVNVKNQVYNDPDLNRADNDEAWPNGSQKGLDKRVQVADKAFRGATPGRRVFLSLHADNNPTSPYGTGVYALATDAGVDRKSADFAEKLVPFLGQNAYARTQNFAVLRDNDADYKLLIEVHNLASEDQSQAMRAGSSRQLSAQKIVRGILEALGR